MDIHLIGVKTNNCKDISVKIPLHSITCVTGVSGSGKSSLVFATLYQESLRRFTTSLSRQDSQFIRPQSDARLENAFNLPPAVAVKQPRLKRDSRSTLGTLTEVSDLMRLVYCQMAEIYCYRCEKKVLVHDASAAVSAVMARGAGKTVLITAPLRFHRGDRQFLLTHLQEQGFRRFMTVDRTLIQGRDLSAQTEIDTVVIARIPVSATNAARLQEAIKISQRISRGRVFVVQGSSDEDGFMLTANRECLTCGLVIDPPDPAYFSRQPEKQCSYRIGGAVFTETMHLTAQELHSWLQELRQTDHQHVLNTSIYLELKERLNYLNKLKIGYLAFDRAASSLSWGELQRARLALCLSTELVDTLYCLDEPTTGLHCTDSRSIFALLKQLRDRGNTIVVVEHDRYFIHHADHLIVLGPAAGRYGGKIIYAGPPSSYCLPALEIDRARLDIVASDLKFITVSGVRTHNLKNIDVRFPCHRLTCVCGVSGCGKSSLVHHTLYPVLAGKLGKGLTGEYAPRWRDITWDGEIADIILMDQALTPRSRRSNVATFLDIYTGIRERFAALSVARRRGFTKAYFSYNAPQGRCSVCVGLGFTEKDLSYLGVVREQCPACRGKRFRDEVLTIELGGKNIKEVLELTLLDAGAFFQHRPEMTMVIEKGIALGLGYLTLGQPLSSLSGGEMQRLRLLKMFMRGQPPSVFIFDEPSMGLADQDIAVYLRHVDLLVAAGHTVIIIDHHLQIIDHADWIIELGPQAAIAGGEVIYNGSRENFYLAHNSATANLLREER